MLRNQLIYSAECIVVSIHQMCCHRYVCHGSCECCDGLCCCLQEEQGEKSHDSHTGTMFGSKVTPSPNPTPSSMKIDNDEDQQVTAVAIQIMSAGMLFMYFLDCLFVFYVFP